MDCKLLFAIYNYDAVVMRKASKPQHPLGVLRGIIDIGQSDLAEMVRRSPRTIQAVEINRLPLSEELAVRIGHETGASVRWLLRGDPNEQPLANDELKVPYTKEVFDTTRAYILAGKDFSRFDVQQKQLKGIYGDKVAELFKKSGARESSLQDPNLDFWISSLLASIFAAERAGRAEIALYRVAQFIKSMVDEFGCLVDEGFTKHAVMTLGDGLFRLKSTEQALRSGLKLVSLIGLINEDDRKQEAVLLTDACIAATLRSKKNAEALWSELSSIGEAIINRAITQRNARAELVEELIAGQDSQTHGTQRSSDEQDLVTSASNAKADVEPSEQRARGKKRNRSVAGRLAKARLT